MISRSKYPTKTARSTHLLPSRSCKPHPWVLGGHRLVRHQTDVLRNSDGIAGQQVVPTRHQAAPHRHRQNQARIRVLLTRGCRRRRAACPRSAAACMPPAGLGAAAASGLSRSRRPCRRRRRAHLPCRLRQRRCGIGRRQRLPKNKRVVQVKVSSRARKARNELLELARSCLGSLVVASKRAVQR